MIDKQKILRNRRYYIARLSIILSYVDLKNKSIIDLGCGEMLLKQLIGNDIKDYTGIDEHVFHSTYNFIHGNILEELKQISITDKSVFILGVFDHLNQSEVNEIIDLLKEGKPAELIINYNNPKSLFTGILKRSNINLESPFTDYHFKKLYLLKFPFSQKVFDLTDFVLRKFIATEVVWIGLFAPN